MGKRSLLRDRIKTVISSSPWMSLGVSFGFSRKSFSKKSRQRSRTSTGTGRIRRRDGDETIFKERMTTSYEAIRAPVRPLQRALNLARGLPVGVLLFWASEPTGVSLLGDTIMISVKFHCS